MVQVCDCIAKAVDSISGMIEAERNAEIQLIEAKYENGAATRDAGFDQFMNEEKLQAIKRIDEQFRAQDVTKNSSGFHNINKVNRKLFDICGSDSYLRLFYLLYLFMPECVDNTDSFLDVHKDSPDKKRMYFHELLQQMKQTATEVPGNEKKKSKLNFNDVCVHPFSVCLFGIE